MYVNILVEWLEYLFYHILNIVFRFQIIFRPGTASYLYLYLTLIPKYGCCRVDRIAKQMRYGCLNLSELEKLAYVSDHSFSFRLVEENGWKWNFMQTYTYTTYFNGVVLIWSIFS